MRAVVQRVAQASVTVDGVVTGAIGPGLLVLLGVAVGDGADEAQWMAQRIVRLRIFPDDAGKMNRSVADTGGGVLVVSQFTLCADAEGGNRPSFTGAAPPAVAEPLYRACVDAIAAALGRAVPTGIFRADMRVALVNDGPVTIILDRAPGSRSSPG
jgi:D-tyrosyl-tRNA(Tyr) deacylase